MLLMNALNKMDDNFFVPVPGVNHFYYADFFFEKMAVEPDVVPGDCYVSLQKDVPLQREWFY